MSISLSVGGFFDLSAKILLPENPVQALEQNVFSEKNEKSSLKPDSESQTALDPTDFIDTSEAPGESPVNPLTIESYEGW